MPLRWASNLRMFAEPSTTSAVRYWSEFMNSETRWREQCLPPPQRSPASTAREQSAAVNVGAFSVSNERKHSPPRPKHPHRPSPRARCLVMMREDADVPLRGDALARCGWGLVDLGALRGPFIAIKKKKNIAGAHHRTLACAGALLTPPCCHAPEQMARQQDAMEELKELGWYAGPAAHCPLKSEPFLRCPAPRLRVLSTGVRQAWTGRPLLEVSWAIHSKDLRLAACSESRGCPADLLPRPSSRFSRNSFTASRDRPWKPGSSTSTARWLARRRG